MSISKNDVDGFAYRDLYSGFIRLHIFHHAVEEPFGLEMAEELARHGYRISLGTFYPLLHGLEKKDTCAQPSSGMANQFAKYIEPRPRDGGRSQP